MIKKIMAVLMMIVFTCSVAFAQTRPKTNEELSISPQASEESVQMSEDVQGNVTLDFRDADIRSVLEILSLKSGINIVAGPEVSGIVTIQLKDVPWQQALQVILQTYGYASEQKGNIIVVTTVENLKKRREDASLLAEQEPLETQTFTLNFGKASDIIASIEKMKSDKGTINFDTRTNMLIVTDTPSKIEKMTKVIAELDATTPLVLIEAKIIETGFSDEESLGIDWVTQATASGSARDISWPFKIGSTDSKYAGSITTPAAANVTYGTLDFSALQAVFEALKTKTDTNILSNPRIVTLDNQKAQIVVGEQYPLPTYTYNEEQARLQVSGWEYKDVGIIFDVTPHVNKAGFVTLDVEPKITAITTFVTVENTSVPRLSTETAKTSVMIKDGETLVIGGLIKTTKSDTKKKTPILGDIPIVGYAFQKADKEGTKTDLLIFMTPHIITPEIKS